MLQKIDKGKRRVLGNTVKLVGAGVVFATLTQSEQAYAAATTIVRFKSRNENVVHSTHTHATRTTGQTLSQHQTISIDATPDPSLQATETAIDIEKTKVDIQSEQLTIQKQQTDNQAAFLQDEVVPIGSFITVLVGVITIGATIWKGIIDFNEQRKIQNENQATAIRNQHTAQQTHEDELYQKALDGLGSNNSEARAAAATQLLIFLDQPGYERFYKPIFNIAVTHFRQIGLDPDRYKKSYEVDTYVFVNVFKTAVKRLHTALYEKEKWGEKIEIESYLEASNMCMSNFNTSIFLLNGIDFSYMNLQQAEFTNSSLKGAKFEHADLTEASLDGTDLTGADFTEANPEAAYSLKGAKMIGVVGLSDKQHSACLAKEAIF